MISLIGFILYFAGYTFDYDDNLDDLQLSIERRFDNYIAVSRTVKEKSVLRKFVSKLYALFITCTILWSVPYGLYMAVRDNNFYLFGRTLFQVLIALQYYYAHNYFNKNHFYENIVCNSQLKKYIKITTPLSLCISVIIAIINVCLLNYNFRIHIYDDIFFINGKTSKIVISLLLFFDSIYSYLTFILNAFIFSINMLYHRKIVTDYAEKLEEYIKNSIDIIKKLNNIAIEYSQMKNKFSNTVELLNPFFSSLNFIGFIVLFFYLEAINNRTLGIIEYINLTMFILIELVYIIAIQSVNAGINSIGDTLSSNNLITTFYGQKKTIKIMPFIDKRNDDYLLNSLNIERRGSTVASPAHDLTINVIGNNTHNEYHGHYNFSKNNNDYQTIIKDLTTTQELLKDIMISSISSDHMIDWMILKSIVEQQWESFKLFGIEFNDTSLISKFFGLIIACLVTSQFGIILNWW